MFLICNGILAFLSKSSVSSSKTSAFDAQSNLDDEGQLSSTPNLSSTKAEAAHVDQEVPVASVEPLQDVVLVTEEEEEEGQEDKEMHAAAEEEKEATSTQALMIPEEEEDIEEKGGFLVKEEEEEGGNEELAGTEELNRRIEEFIRRMKEEIRIEAQQQLIAV